MILVCHMASTGILHKIHSRLTSKRKLKVMCVKAVYSDFKYRHTHVRVRNCTKMGLFFVSIYLIINKICLNLVNLRKHTHCTTLQHGMHWRNVTISGFCNTAPHTTGKTVHNFINKRFKYFQWCKLTKGHYDEPKVGFQSNSTMVVRSKIF